MFSKRGRKNPTNCGLSFFFFFQALFFFEGAGDQARIIKVAEIIFGQTKPHQESQFTAPTPVRSSDVSFRATILCHHPRHCYAKLHSVHSPELGTGMPNRDVTGYMATLNNVGLGCDILNKTELFVSRTGTSVTELCCQRQNGLESQT